MLKPQSTVKFREEKQSSKKELDLEKLKKFASEGEKSLDLNAKERPRKAYFDKYYENMKASSTNFSANQNAFVEAVVSELYTSVDRTSFSLLLRSAIELLSKHKDNEMVRMLVSNQIGFLKEKKEGDAWVNKTYLLTNEQRDMLNELTKAFKDAFLLRRKDVLLLAIMFYAESEIGMNVNNIISKIRV